MPLFVTDWLRNISVFSLVYFSLSFFIVKAEAPTQGYLSPYYPRMLFPTAEAFGSYACDQVIYTQWNGQDTTGTNLGYSSTYETLDSIQYFSEPTQSNPHPVFYYSCGLQNWNYISAVVNGVTYYNIKGPLIYRTEQHTYTTGWYYFCPAGYPQPYGANYCGSLNPKIVSPNLNKGRCKFCEGNPINPLVGNKYQVELDFVGGGAFPIRLERIYNSFGSGPGAPVIVPIGDSACPYGGCKDMTLYTPPAQTSNSSAITSNGIGVASNSPFDAGWRHSYDRTLTAFYGDPIVAALFRPDSKTRTFTQNGNGWIADSGQLNTQLTQQTDSDGNILGWTYKNENDETEIYNKTGNLLSITARSGLVQNLQYNSLNKLSAVIDASGRKLQFIYDPVGRVSEIIDPSGGIYLYSYDTNYNLASITYPNSRVRSYVYEDTNYLTALSGVIDENGSRYATWTYNDGGSAISSEHGVGIEKVTLAYTSPTTTIATDASGAVRTYTALVINGIAQASQIVETCGTNCSRTRSMSYDSNGNVSSDTDFNGNVTTYQYDLSRDLETSRTEASGTPQARTTTTTWHPNYRLPLQIAEPKRLTTFTDDASGNVLTKTVQATTDANGSQGLSASLTGKARTWTNTYNSFGQILTATGPRTDVNDTTIYSYDTSGNLTSITNAAGHVTAMSNYDLNGRVGMITAPNGETTSLTYTPRGWLSSKVVTANGVSETTSYNYDGVGQLIQVTLPDSSTVSYTYDDAHRLTGMNDSLGNSIAYTLDNMGNRISEQVKDTGGVLARQTSRVFDALSRLQQQTGGVQ